MVDSAGYESLVNFRTVDNYLIIERVSSVFTLRNGSSTVCLFNETIPFKKGKGYNARDMGAKFFYDVL